MLNKLEEKLKEIDSNIFYGVAGSPEEVNFIWNYCVFGRSRIKSNETKKSFTDVYEVIIVRENYIPEGFFEKVVEKVEECGLRLASEDSLYEYDKKDADTVVEILKIYFTKAKKRCC